MAIATDIYQPVQDIKIEDDPFNLPTPADLAPSKPARRSNYNPGLPGAITFIGNGLFEVESFRVEGDTHMVDIHEGTCSCQHFCWRIAPRREAGLPADDCKHLKYVKAEIQRRLAARKMAA